MLDDYTLCMSDNLSGVFMPITKTADLSAMAVVSKQVDTSICVGNNMSESDDMVQVLHDG